MFIFLSNVFEIYAHKFAKDVLSFLQQGLQTFFHSFILPEDLQNFQHLLCLYPVENRIFVALIASSSARACSSSYASAARLLSNSSSLFSSSSSLTRPDQTRPDQTRPEKCTRTNARTPDHPPLLCDPIFSNLSNL